jgi:hypothetical protein
MQQARNLSATERRLLHDTNVANQRPSFWSGLKTTNPAISSLLKSRLTVYCRLHTLDEVQRASGVVRQGRRHGPIMCKITPCWVTLLQPPRRAAVMVQPSSLQPHWIRVLCFSIQECSRWLMNRTFSCAAYISCWSSWEGRIVRWQCRWAPSPPWLIF